ncbi:MAG: L-threonylcarbamoyladenylate synthase [Candidatus Diapherotrites archaeon]|nr:L-threonylcarbamoyladenylate synthase [Candidatus Diapherotrites archaeon]
METIVLKLNPKRPDKKKIKKAADIIKSGGLVVFPTETVYGLGANAFDKSAVRRIFETKGRPTDNPLIVHIYSKRQLNEITKEAPKIAKKLANKFWPGALTLILKKKQIIPSEVTCGLRTVAVRMPSHSVARALCKEAGVPIAAPSANISGRPSITSGRHAIEEFLGKVECIIDAGQTDIGLESTVLDMTSKVPELLRPGGITPEEIMSVCGEIKVGKVAKAKGEESTPKSPGTKYRHYAPKAKVILAEGPEKKAIILAEKIAKAKAIEGKKVALLLLKTERNRCHITNLSGKIKSIQLYGKKNIAKRLFFALRKLDSEKTEIIVANAIDENGLGLAIMNRLRKASTIIVA